MDGYTFLRSRSWKLTREGWVKRGWCLGWRTAVLVENYMERTYGGVIPRGEISDVELSKVIARVDGAAHKVRSESSPGVSPLNRNPLINPWPGDVLMMRWGVRAEIIDRTDHCVWVEYSIPGLDKPQRQRYGVPNAWTTETSVGAEVLHVAEVRS